MSRTDRHIVLGLTLLLAVCCLALLVGEACAARPGGLEKQIAQEQARAKARRESLSRLTAEERTLDKELAASEVAILRLESSLEKEARTLADLAGSDAELRVRALSLEAEQAKTESAMADVLRVLWEIQARREGVGGRDLPDWHVTDREHAWSAELLAALETHRKTLADRHRELEGVAVKRSALQREAASRMRSLNREKEELLARRVRYEQRLSALRQEKRETEDELQYILALVRNLNLRQQEAEQLGDIAKAKGKLPWPVSGKLAARYNPSAKPPVRGITVALDRDSPIMAVHGGKVVHNDVVRGIGRVVIILHGEDYYSLYAFLSASDLAVGQEVSRGEVVGTSGFVTSIEGPGLYFELRHHQQAVNPEQWLTRS